MIQRSPLWQVFAVLFGLLGCIGGAAVGVWDFNRYVAALREADPEAYICGLPAIGAMIGGGALGGFTGTFAGAIVGYVTSRRMS